LRALGISEKPGDVLARVNETVACSAGLNEYLFDFILDDIAQLRPLNTAIAD
jgi:hypothetical protein